MNDKIFNDSERNKNLRSSILKSFISGLMSDEERADLWNLPSGCRMRENSKIISPENFKCGENVWIGEGAVLDASGKLEIGSHTSIGLNVMIWTHTSFLTNLTMSNERESSLIMRAKTTIGKGCFIGGPSVVYHGVKLGDKTVVLPMSVVTKDFPGNCIIGGSPAKMIKEIDDEFIDEQIQKVKDAK